MRTENTLIVNTLTGSSNLGIKGQVLVGISCSGISRGMISFVQW